MGIEHKRDLTRLEKVGLFVFWSVVFFLLITLTAGSVMVSDPSAFREWPIKYHLVGIAISALLSMMFALSFSVAGGIFCFECATFKIRKEIVRDPAMGYDVHLECCLCGEKVGVEPFDLILRCSL